MPTLLPLVVAGSSYAPAARTTTVMLKTVLLVLAGLAAGLAIASWLQPSAPAPSDAGATSGLPAATRIGTDGADAASAGPARLAALEDALAAEVERRAALEARVGELAAQLEALGRRPPSDSPEAELRLGGREGDPERAASREDRARRGVEDLIAAGFPPDRAAWIDSRAEQLRMEALQAQYDARREGRPLPPGFERSGESTLRTELGDADYERYLTAMRRPTSIGVGGVLSSSPAERSGLQAGDEIVAYDGKRVFDIAELNELTLEGTPGESVVVEVRRDGQNLQLVMPRGPIGIFGGFRRR